MRMGDYSANITLSSFCRTFCNFRCKGIFNYFYLLFYAICVLGSILLEEIFTGYFVLNIQNISPPMKIFIMKLPATVETKII